MERTVNGFVYCSNIIAGQSIVVAPLLRMSLNSSKIDVWSPVSLQESRDQLMITIKLSIFRSVCVYLRAASFASMNDGCGTTLL